LDSEDQSDRDGADKPADLLALWEDLLRKSKPERAEPPFKDPEALRAYVENELANQRGSPRLLSEKWETASRTSRRTGVPLRDLQLMREAGVGPRWRPRGHRIIYHAREFDEWLARCPSLDDSHRLPSLVRRFIDTSGPHEQGGWRWCADVSLEFYVFVCGPHSGRAPKGWKRALWDGIRLSENFVVSRKITYRGFINSDGDSDFAQGEQAIWRRCVLGWGRYQNC
jgi:hypothetical protein